MNACLWVFFFNVFSPYKNFSKVTSSHYQKRLHSLDWQCYLHFPLQETPGLIICPSLIPVNFTESDFKDYLSLFFFYFLFSSSFILRGSFFQFESCCCQKPFFHSVTFLGSKTHPGISSLKPEQIQQSRKEKLCHHQVSLSSYGSPSVKFNPRQV